MEYKILKVNFPLCEEGRFYRTFAVSEDMNLKELGCAILTSLLSTVIKDYFFTVGIIRYLPQHLIRQYYEHEDKLISDYKLSDLPNEFTFSYGADEYFFDCSILRSEQLNSEANIVLLDGKGQGIWEDGYFTFLAYLNGKVDPEGLEEDYFEDIIIPKNVKLSKYSDFETSFDLETVKECFYGLYTIRLELLETKKEESMYVDILTQIVNHHRDIYSFVEDTYNRLIVNYSHGDVYSMIHSVFIDLAVDYAELDEEFNEEAYKEKLSLLK